jgi:transposase
MAWTAEDRRRYAPAVQEMVRQGMLVRLAATIDRIDPPSRVGRPRLWSTLIMLQALWHLARDGCAWRRLPPGLPPHQSVWSRFSRWRLRAVLDRALAVLVACRRLAAGRKRRPTATIIDTRSVRTGPHQATETGHESGAAPTVDTLAVARHSVPPALRAPSWRVSSVCL